jgi:hypothetical protein
MDTKWKARGLRGASLALGMALATGCGSVGVEQQEEWSGNAWRERSLEGKCEVRPPFTPSFSPELEWQWTGSTVLPNHKQVMMTPVVVDVNGDGTPDVVFNSFSGSNYTTDGVLRAISGDDGHELWTVTNSQYRVRGASSIAAGDIDHDGKVEICTIPESSLGFICFENDGTFKFRATSSGNDWGGVSLADLDGDGNVEIINGNSVFSNTGVLKWTGVDGLGGLNTGPVSFAANIDLDGALEVINDRAIYRADGTLKCRNTALPHGLAGVGNFDADPFGEVVIVGDGKVVLMDDDCKQLWSANIPGGGSGGAPNIADFDGDGQPEIGVAGASNYVVFETNGTLKWSKPTQDFSSNRTGSSTFDFEGDGKAEVVYADELRLRIYDGATGAIRMDELHSSGTTYENPVIVDVDGDDNAEIVMIANNYGAAGRPSGIRVFRDKNDGWVNTRRIWNQHAYSVTNVNDDGTIPAHPATNWLTAGLNTFRSNSQGVGTTSPFAASDVTVAPGLAASCDPESLAVTLSATVVNQGDAATSKGLKVAFYKGTPRTSGGALLGVATVAGSIAAKGSASVTLRLDTAPGGDADVWAVADDDGTGLGRETECREDNNAASAHLSLACVKPSTGGWTLTGSMALPRLLHTATLLPSGQVLVAGGFNVSAELYDETTRVWTATGNTITTHRGHTATLLPNGQVLIVGGGECPLTRINAELYNPTTGRWSAARNLLQQRYHHTASLLPNGKVLVVGGNGSEYGDDALSSAEIYDPATNLWSYTGALTQARGHHTATTLPNGKVLIAGGFNAQGQALATAELYDPATGRFTAVGSMGLGRGYHTASLLPNGQVLVAGGAGIDPTQSASAELYNPATGTWKATGSMKQPRRSHTATLLPNGQVLVAGGYHQATGIQTASDLYDPATGTWSVTYAMNVDRYGQTATLLPNGTVLAAGGVSNHDQSSAEFYTP